MVDTKGKNVEEHTRVDERPTSNIIVEDEEDHDSDSEGETDKQPIKKRNRRGTPSFVWDYFTRISLKETKGIHKARCNYCPNKIYNTHPSLSGTSSLKKHMENTQTIQIRIPRDNLCCQLAWIK